MSRARRATYVDLEAMQREREVRLARRTSRQWVAGYPHLVAQWHPTKNGVLFPDEVSYGSQRRVWWKCPEGPDHEWRAVVGSRTSFGYGCPFCAGQRPSVTNSLVTRVPAIAAEWHPRKNGRKTPAGVVWSSGVKVWWRCPAAADHEWRATVNARTSGGSGCPFCAGRRVSVTNTVAAVAPAFAAQWDDDENDERADEVSASSTREVAWRCRAGPDHVWRASPSDRIRHDRGCPFCAGRRPSATNSLAAVYPAIAREWHPTKNGSLTPNDVTRAATRRVFWRCSANPEHVWLASIGNRTRNGSGCPHCHRARRERDSRRRGGR